MSDEQTYPHIALISAMPQEMKSIVARMGIPAPCKSGTVHSSTHRSRTVSVCVSGVGMPKTRHTLSKCDTLKNASLAIITGVCGAAAAGIPVGTTHLPDTIHAEGNLPIAVNEILRSEPNAAAAILRGGAMWCAPRLVLRREKQQLRSSAPSIRTVDMESYVCAYHFHKIGIPVIIAKTVCETAGFPMPDEQVLINYSKRSVWHAQLRQTLRHPIRTLTIAILQYNVRYAIMANTDCIVRILNSLP